jgi:uncharacterized protein
MPDKPRAVIDTNVLLDWLVFRDPRAAAVGDAISSGRLEWVACAAMRAEFERVIEKPALARWGAARERVLADFDRHVNLQPAPERVSALRCSDPDDQIFLDLAVAAGPCALLSRDRALLALRRPAAALGIVIGTPERWIVDAYGAAQAAAADESELR